MGPWEEFVSWASDPGPPLGMEPLYRGPDDHWLYGLRAADLYSPPAVEPGAAPAAFAKSDYMGVVPGDVTTFRITPGVKAMGDWFSDATGWTPAPSGEWTNIFAGDTTGGKAFPTSDPLGIADATRYASTPRSPLPFLPGLQLPKFSIPGLTTPAPAAPGAMSMSSLLIYGALALAVVLLVRK